MANKNRGIELERLVNSESSNTASIQQSNCDRGGAKTPSTAEPLLYGNLVLLTMEFQDSLDKSHIKGYISRRTSSRLQGSTHW